MTNPTTTTEPPAVKRGWGRPRADAPLPRRNIRMDAGRWAYVLAQGGTAFLRRLIDSHRAGGKD